MLLHNLTRSQVQGRENPPVRRALVEAGIQTGSSGSLIVETNFAVPHMSPFLLGMTGKGDGGRVSKHDGSYRINGLRGHMKGSANPKKVI
jgi:hypothetical protein